MPRRPVANGYVKRFARFSRPGHRVTGDRYRSAKEKRAGVGWEYAHSMIDDHSRLVYTELLDDEQAPTVTGFVERALAFYATHGISAKRLQTDNHFSYAKNRSLRELLAREGIRHRFIPPRTPKRNGKVERYQQTLAREWAYGQRFRSPTWATATSASPRRRISRSASCRWSQGPGLHAERRRNLARSALETGLGATDGRRAYRARKAAAKKAHKATRR